MRNAAVWALALGMLVLLAPANADKYKTFDGLPSHKLMPQSWDYGEEVEHKGSARHRKISSCVSLDDLVKVFPAGGLSGSYFDYVAQNQIGRHSSYTTIGVIGDTEIIELVHNFQEPIDYMKILAFRPKGSALVCPFLLVAEWNWQLEYSPSQLAGTKVVTRMVDNVAARGKSVLEMSFDFSSGLPQALPQSGPMAWSPSSPPQ